MSSAGVRRSATTSAAIGSPVCMIRTFSSPQNGKKLFQMLYRLFVVFQLSWTYKHQRAAFSTTFGWQTKDSSKTSIAANKLTNLLEKNPNITYQAGTGEKSIWRENTHKHSHSTNPAHVSFCHLCSRLSISSSYSPRRLCRPRESGDLTRLLLLYCRWELPDLPSPWSAPCPRLTMAIDITCLACFLYDVPDAMPDLCYNKDTKDIRAPRKTPSAKNTILKIVGPRWRLSDVSRESYTMPAVFSVCCSMLPVVKRRAVSRLSRSRCSSWSSQASSSFSRAFRSPESPWFCFQPLEEGNCFRSFSSQ